ncbi:VC0807 family protein [Streptomyces sp. NPDC001793]|uniref:VC0807 family protein n=1 Tax=Streptomyces sp. NPDC001793 TaxID=3154657 RepID=UPI00333251D0
MESQQQSAGSQLGKALMPLVVDAGIPMASYYVLGSGFGMSDVAALAWSSVVPALRTVWGLVRERSVNALALLMLVVNVVGLATSTLTGDPRLMMAKDSATSSVIGLAMLLSAVAGRPLMSAGLKPWVTKGGPEGTAAWDRLRAHSARFRRLERRFTLIWGGALLTDCVVKAVGAYVLPVHVMVWLGTVLTVVSILVASVAGGACSAECMGRMVEADIRDARRDASDGAGAVPADAAAVPAAV